MKKSFKNILKSEELKLENLLLQYYDKLLDKYKAIIPFKKVYIPDVSDF